MPRQAALGCVGFLAWFRARAHGIFFNESRSKVVEVLTACHFVSRDEIKGASCLGPEEDASLILSRETKWQAVKSAATLDRDLLRKILREKFRTKINTPRERENVRRTGVVTLVQITAVQG